MCKMILHFDAILKSQASQGLRLTKTNITVGAGKVKKDGSNPNGLEK